jgi:hypothetical protein
MYKMLKMFKRVVWSKLLGLNSDQSKLFHSYCELFSNSSITGEKRVEEKTRIWQEALEDAHLTHCLNLIDYFVSCNSSDSITNERIFLSEYLIEDLHKLAKDSEREDLLINDKEEFMNIFNFPGIPDSNFRKITKATNCLGGLQIDQGVATIKLEEQYLKSEDEPPDHVSIRKIGAEAIGKASELFTEALIRSLNCRP